MPSADQVPVKSPHSRMQWHIWVVLIAGSTGPALRAVRPPNPHITPPVLAPRSNAASGRARSRPRNTGCVIQARIPLVSIDLKRIAQRRPRQFAVRALSERVSVVPASIPLPYARNERLYAWVVRPALAGVVAHCRKAIQPWDMWIFPHIGD
jgi:hypothetical protein